MTTTRFRGSLGFQVGYGVFVAAAGVTALVLTWRATGSLWWALLALLLAGPVAQILLRAIGIDPFLAGRPRRRW
jgi:hypothetical protein